jgi:hypothetical protein
VQVEEARKEERLGRAVGRPLDGRDPSVLDDDRSAEGAVDRVDDKSL